MPRCTSWFIKYLFTIYNTFDYDFKMTKIIFSRKGFDSSTGGMPSYKKDETLISFPIPSQINTLTTYNDLNLGKNIQDLSNNKIKATDTCHFDPNLDYGEFGQVGAAQTHLKNNNVKVGDLFLFWGWFRETITINRKTIFSKKDPGHYRFFGWLQIGKIIHLGKDPSWYLAETEQNPNSTSHPHTIGHWKENNTLYLASKKLDAFGLKDYYGFGKFKASEKTNLSINPSIKKSKWKCPKWLNPKHGGCGMTYHNDLTRWDENTVDVVGRGQEFVAVPNKVDECEKWLRNIFRDAKTIEEVEYFKQLSKDITEEALRRAYVHKDQWIKDTFH